ncbi:hypothetical protein V8F33_011162 [Rhypophila sp. PSN 637]
MQLSATALLFGAISLASGVMGQDKPPANFGVKFTNGIEVLNTGVNGGLSAVPGSSYTRTRWAWGTIPRTCYNQAVEGYCNPYDMEIYDVKYSDCGTPVTICRCNNAPMTINQLSDAIGKLPVKGRQWALYFSHFTGNSCSAWAAGVNIAILGNCQQSAVFHELTHVLDSYALNTNGQAYSRQGEWAQIVLKGSCVATYYARGSGWPESYAEAGVMTAYHVNVRSIWDLDVGCMADQMGKNIEQLGGILKRQSGATCNRLWAKDPAVCMGPAARDAGNCPGLRRDVAAPSASAGGIMVEVPPVLAPEEQKIAEEEKVEAAKVAGYLVNKNGTVTWPEAEAKRSTGAPKGFMA